MERQFFDFLETPGRERTQKPRETGRTMATTRGYIPEHVLEAFSECIDTVKLLDRILWAPDETEP